MKNICSSVYEVSDGSNGGAAPFLFTVSLYACRDSHGHNTCTWSGKSLALRRAWFEASKSYYLQEVLILTWNAALSPPLSAMFSPSVRFPLIYKFMTSREQNMPMISSILQKSTHIVSKHLILGVLSCKALLSFFECCDGLICPPGPEVTSFVISLACMDRHNIHVVYYIQGEMEVYGSHWGVTHQ